jgi:hypothetical protein
MHSAESERRQVPVDTGKEKFPVNHLNEFRMAVEMRL